jgi:cytochrome oxidase assembly protein ShyY1
MIATLSGLQFRAGRYPTLAFLLLFPLLLSLGFWQLDRAEQKQALLAAQAARSNEMPVALWQLTALTDQDRFRPAVARGRFVAGRQWLQDNRVHAGQVGYHVYSLFEFEGGRGVLVNRGWVPAGASRQDLPMLPLPEGELQISGRLSRPASVGMQLGEADYLGMGGMQRVPYLDVQQLAAAIGRDLLPMVLELGEGQPGALTPDPLTATQIGPEKHVGYAVQWFGLATALLIIYVGLNARQVKKES